MALLQANLQAGHSYPINPGSLASGSTLTTSSIMVLHRGHEKPRLIETSATGNDPLR
jgi:hypothetical protein